MTGYNITRNVSAIAFDLQQVLGGRSIIDKVVCDFSANHKSSQIKLAFPIYMDYIEYMHEIRAPESAIRILRSMAYKTYSSSKVKYDKTKIILKLKANKTATFKMEEASKERASALLVFMQRHGYMLATNTTSTDAKPKQSAPRRKEQLLLFLSTDEGDATIRRAIRRVRPHEKVTNHDVFRIMVGLSLIGDKLKRYVNVDNIAQSDFDGLASLLLDVK